MIQERDVVLCTVKKIEGTTVFLEIDKTGQQASMTFSEVAPGRIRNIREFVVINKKVVCKVLRVKDNHIELSLRRVTGGEREQIMKDFKRAAAFESMIKPVLKEKAASILKKIEEKYDLIEFLDMLKEKPSAIKEFVQKSESDALEKVFAEKKEKKKEIRQKVLVKSSSPSGIDDIKHILSHDADIRYLGSSTFQIIIEDTDFKKANNRMESLLKEMKDRAKSRKAEFETK